MPFDEAVTNAIQEAEAMEFPPENVRTRASDPGATRVNGEPRYVVTIAPTDYDEDNKIKSTGAHELNEFGSTLLGLWVFEFPSLTTTLSTGEQPDTGRDLVAHQVADDIAASYLDGTQSVSQLDGDPVALPYGIGELLRVYSRRDDDASNFDNHEFFYFQENP